MTRTTVCLLTLVAAAWSDRPVAAQTVRALNYANSYSNKITPYKRPSVSPRLNTFNKYYYHNPAISPYSNLMRRSGSTTSNYYQYVKPELDRRSKLSNPPLRSVGPAGTFSPRIRTSAPRTTSSYYGHYYGGRQLLGLK